MTWRRSQGNAGPPKVSLTATKVPVRGPGGGLGAARPWGLYRALVGVGVLGLGAVFVGGATTISSDAGYAGVGPNFLPWVVGLALLVCGAALLREAHQGGWSDVEEAAAVARGDWLGFAWVSAGVLSTAALITTLGFILSCTLCFVLAVRGFKISQGQLDLSLRAWIVDAAIGAAIAAPVFWMFTKLLAISLPGLTTTGWL
jgi:putative tricarboxylic transport membrane protein